MSTWQLDAMRVTLAKASEAAWRFPADGPASLEHLQSMVFRASMVDDMSDAKMGRWLGYMQGVMVALNVASLDEVKEINRKCSRAGKGIDQS